MSITLPKLFVALDGISVGAAVRLVRQVGNSVGYKVNDIIYDEGFRGLLFAIAGANAELFVDLKLHDIPNTVANTVRRVVDTYAPAAITIHCAGGKDMAKAAKAACGSTKLIGVTVLTSAEKRSLPELYDIAGPVLEHVDGYVCAASDVEALADMDRSKLFVVPGIRPYASVPDDQVRTATPAEAVRVGASWLVVGRPVVAAVDPVVAVRSLLRDIESAVDLKTQLGPRA